MTEKNDFSARLDAMRDDVEALAAEVRRLVAATVGADAPRAAIVEATRDVARIADALERHVPTPHPPRYPGGNAPVRDAADFFPFDPVIGRLSPIAPPVKVEWHDPVAVGLVRFTVPYEGPPGCVHGAILAATFDQVFNVANLMRGVAGPTRKLEIRYRKPTPLLAELRFEGWVDRIEGREVHTRGRVLHGDVVTVEAEGTFVQLSHERVMRLLDGAPATPTEPTPVEQPAAGEPTAAPPGAGAPVKPAAKASAAARK
ncbi:PaaI family thioesterase, partial [Candidatus Binatia bacterium]|nr:PaaI family thioesterase [Candidatus Binatia bacterium]